MPRQLRIEYPGAGYHVLARGDLREDIAHDDGMGSADLELREGLFGLYCDRTPRIFGSSPSMLV